MKRIFLGISLSICVFLLQGQSLKFDRLVHDFTTFEEVKGEVRCEFSYQTSSSEAVYLTAVSSTSKMLRFTWSRELLPTNGQGTIIVLLNPRDGNGQFDYPINVKVRENDKERIYTLHVKGNIIPRIKTKEEIYPMKEGSLRYKSNYVRYEKCHPNTVKIDTFFFYNETTKAMTYNCNPAYLKPSVELIYLTPSLPSLGEGMLIFKFDASKQNEWGTFMERIRMETNDSLGVAKTFYISGEIFDDFDSWTSQQKANAPKIKIDNPDYNFAPVKAGEMVSHDFVITNEGVDTLYLRKFKASCSCTVAKPDKDKLARGEQTSVKVTLNTHGKTGKQHRTVDVISNDPDNPKVRLQVIGDVKPME